MVHGLFNEFSALYLLFDQFTRGREFHFYFDLLETPVVPDQSFADQVNCGVPLIFKAEVIVQVHPAFNDLTAAIAFNFEHMVSLFRFGRTTAEEVFEEAHIILSNETLLVE